MEVVEKSALDICRDKFHEGEIVISIFEAYQINEEHQNRLLALAHRNGAYAIFSFTLSNHPPLSFVDLTIDNIFPIDGNFRIDSPEVGISKLQFKISTENGQNMFYYYPCTSYSFQSFYSDISAAEVNYQVNADRLDFSWLNPYKRVDQSAIMRSIADGRTLLKNRESKFIDELKKREHEYTVYEPFKIFVATWNVNGQPPSDISLNEWLSTTEEVPDIYAIAFQELDLSAKAFTVSETRPDPIWVGRVMDGLHPGAAYEELISVRLVGMMLIVVIRRELKHLVQNFSTAMVGTGALNMMGNKGGVGVSIQLNESHICFVNSHLAAHVIEVQRRKEDHDEILRRMQFEYGITRRNIEEHDHIFWFGDLNYRIIETSKPDLVAFRKQFDQDNFYQEIRNLDQLYCERMKGQVFVGYKEGPVLFKPTYKYDPGTNDWDSSEKCRAPAWCDRVLWKSDQTTQLVYNSVMALQLSDHKPVYSLFVTHIKSRDEQRYKQVHEEVLKTVDKYENDNQPQITVPEKDVDFGVVRFNERIVREITIANNCHLPAIFRFTGKEGNNSPICESWLKIEPTTGRLITGDCLTIRLELFADSKSLWKLHRKQRHSKQSVPLDILVLHVENGHDIFITIIGEYRPSCIGFNMETLCNLSEPIDKLDLQYVVALEKRLEDNSSLQTRDPAHIPRELWFLVDYLFNNGIKTPNLFTLERRYARNPNIVEIRDWLDSWSTEEFPGSPHTAAEMILMLLESTPVPLVNPLEDVVLTSADRYEDCKTLLKYLLPHRKIVFIYVCFFLKEVLKHGASNRLNANKLAKIFAPALLRSRTIGRIDKRQDEEQEERRVKFLIRLLDNDDFVKEFARTDLKVVNRSMPLLDLS